MFIYLLSRVEIVFHFISATADIKHIFEVRHFSNRILIFPYHSFNPTSNLLLNINDRRHVTTIKFSHFEFVSLLLVKNLSERLVQFGNNIFLRWVQAIKLELFNT
jgi:hypothetical protein